AESRGALRVRREHTGRLPPRVERGVVMGGIVLWGEVCAHRPRKIFERLAPTNGPAAYALFLLVARRVDIGGPAAHRTVLAGLVARRLGGIGLSDREAVHHRFDAFHAA